MLRKTWSAYMKKRHAHERKKRSSNPVFASGFPLKNFDQEVGEFFSCAPGYNLTTGNGKAIWQCISLFVRKSDYGFTELVFQMICVP